MSNPFPRTTVAGLSLSRMIIGTNWLAGWSHRSPAADDMIKQMHHEPSSVDPILEAYMEHGVDTIMGLFSATPHIHRSVLNTREKLGRELIVIDTPIVNVDNNEAARREARATIRKSREFGAKFCLLHHSSAEQLVNKNTRTIDRIGDYTSMIREEGMIPGLSAHMPELIVYSDANEYGMISKPTYRSITAWVF